MKLIPTIGLLSIFAFNVYSQDRSKYPDIPRIDVHTHAGSKVINIKNYLRIRETVKNEYYADVAMWINLGTNNNPDSDIEVVNKASSNRMLCAFSDYSPMRGFKHKPEEFENLLNEGYIGYKIWYGSYHRVLKVGEKGFSHVDDPAHEAIFTKMEELGILAASIHISDPNGPFHNRTKWNADPVEYWRQINAFHNVLKKHPDLKVVAAHASWLICQDAQIDYLRYLLATFPNLYIDLAATFQYFPMVIYDNLREFIIEYADRILFGTDISKVTALGDIEMRTNSYINCFRILETDEIVYGSFFGNKPIRGLNLPREVLEKIYYKNAIRIYPKVGERMKELGY